MRLLSQHYAAAKLEQQLGDPASRNSLLSFETSMQLDEAEAFPEQAVDHLHTLQLHHYYVPQTLGGKFRSYEEFLALGRVLARRDLTVAISYSTLLWTTLVWIGGDAAQKRRFADLVMTTREFPCLAYSEEDHGADLLAGGLTAQPSSGGGYCLNGEKWPINRATRSGFLALLAKTDEDAGARGLSLFMLDKRDLCPTSYYHLPRVKTLGLRGCDISGIGFSDCAASSDSRIGQEGKGLELALKGLQVTRTLCASLSLGAGDTALRTVLAFAKERELYNKRVVDLPHALTILTNTFVDLLIGECVGIAASRALHVSTEQFSTWSSIVKYFVPHTIEAAIHDLAVVLGARYYVREKHQWGIFQKILRDNAVVSLFDGSSVVCLHSLGLQLHQLARTRRRATGSSGDIVAQRLQHIFDLHSDLPDFDTERLDLYGRGRDDVLLGLETALVALNKLNPDHSLSKDVLHTIRTSAELLHEQLLLLESELLDAESSRGNPQSVESFDRAKRYCVLHAGATCLQFWLCNRQRMDVFFSGGVWLAAAENRLLHQLPTAVPDLPEQWRHVLAEQMQKLHEHQQMFSLLPLPLAMDQENYDEYHNRTHRYQGPAQRTCNTDVLVGTACQSAALGSELSRS